MILLFDRIIRKIQREYRKTVFRKKIGCKHKDFTLVGSVNVINKNIKIGKNVTIYPDVVFWGDGDIIIGDNVDIGYGTIIFASKAGGVTIGRNSLIAAQCYIIDMDHGIGRDDLIRNQKNDVAAVNIGEDVWLAANVTVLMGSTIHNGAIVGAKALVKGELPEYSISVGIPARVIKYRE